MIKKIPTADLKPGMMVAKLQSSLWEHHPFIYTKPGLVESEAEAERIRDDGFLEVFVDVPEADEQGGRVGVEEIVARRLGGGNRVPPVSAHPMREELGRTEKIYARSLDLARRVVRDVAEGREIDMRTSGELVEELIDSAVRNHQTLVCLSKLDTFDNYTYSHCVNVSALAVVFGRFLDLDHDSLVTLGLAGLFHDLGKTRVPRKILNKPGRLNEFEFKEIQRHPVYSQEILSRQSIDDVIVRAAGEHHEKYNGMGYPAQLPRDKVGSMARILSLADVFDALTSRRPYKESMLTNKALSVMYGMRGQDFDPTDVDLFIKCLGVYPTGSLVRLSNGDHAVVLDSRQDNLLKPLVLLVLSRDARRTGELDLARDPLDDHGNPIRIEECLDPRTARIDVGRTLGVGLTARN